MTTEELQVVISANTQGLRNAMTQVNRQIEGVDSRVTAVGKTMGKTFLIAGTAAAVAGVAVGGLAAKFSDDLQKSLNGVQAQTGTTDKAMGDMKKTMIDIYNNNFGENFADIGTAMADVTKQTGLTGKALQSMTEDAFALKDTFEMEVTDSVKGANQMMKQFGVSGDEAYNLIAQGAQSGLDTNGDLIDTINEYSGTFKAQGFSAEEMFNMLSNGAKAGVKDTDLMADAIKEFGIRAKDGSKGTIQAFKDLGLNSDALTKSFGKGGAEGKKAFEEVTTKLAGMKDPVAQNAAGIALFGTQFEDMGIKGILAMTDTKGAIDKTKDALGAINKVKYNSFGEAMEGIKRNLQTGILLPLGEKILPKLSEFSTYITANMPAIKEKVGIAMDGVSKAFDTIGTAVGKAIEVLTKVGTWINENKEPLTNIAIVLGSFALAFGLVTGAVALWNLVGVIATAVTTGFGVAVAFLTSPIGIVVLAIGAIIAIGILLYKNWDVIKAKLAIFGNAIKTKFTEIKTAVVAKVTELKQGVIDKFNSIKTGITDKVTAIKASVVDKFTEIKTSVTEKVNELKQGVIDKFNAIKTGISDKVTAIKSSIVNKFTEIKTSVTEKVQSMKDAIVNKFTNIKTSVTTVASNIKTSVVDKFNSIKSGASTAFNNVKTAVMTPINNLKDKVSGVVDEIKGFFTGLKISIPHIKMPHFSISGSFNPLKGKIPKLGVDWYATGGVFNSPSVIGVGENGAEAVMPLEKNTGWIDILANKLNGKDKGGGSGITLQIDKFVNNTDDDIRMLMEKMEFYRKQQTIGGRV